MINSLHNEKSVGVMGDGKKEQNDKKFRIEKMPTDKAYQIFHFVWLNPVTLTEPRPTACGHKASKQPISQLTASQQTKTGGKLCWDRCSPLFPQERRQLQRGWNFVPSSAKATAKDRRGIFQLTLFVRGGVPILAQHNSQSKLKSHWLCN